MYFTVEIASVPDRGDVVAEIWFGDAMVAEMYRVASGKLSLDIYPIESDGAWRFDLNDWLNALADAQQKLGSVERCDMHKSTCELDE